MRWPWSKRESTAGAEALEEAEARLREAVERWSDVRQESEKLRRHQETNHFADAIRAIMRGAKP